MNKPSRLVNTEPSVHRRHIGEHLRLRHLRLLELIERGGSLAAASRELHLSQPAVTKMLHELETVFDTALVARGARGGRLTAAGDAVLARLRLALRHFDAALVGVSVAEEPLLRVGLLPLATVALLPAAIRHLRAAGIQLRLSLHEATVAELIAALVAGRVDCVLGRTDAAALAPLSGHAVTRLPLADEGLAVACAPGHPLARARRVTIEHLQPESWVVAPPHSHTRRAFDSAFLDRGLAPPRPIVESLSFHTNLRLLDALNALTLAPLSAVSVYEQMGAVRRVRGAALLSSHALSLMHLVESESLPALQHFVQAVQAVAHR